MRDKTTRSAMHWAMKSLARRMHTAWEIERGLAERGWPSDTVRGVLEDLKGTGYIDDRQFAETWVAGRSESRLHGHYRLLRDLRSRGVEEAVARDAVERLLPPDKEIVIARKAAVKKARSLKTGDIRDLVSLDRHLRSRGFRSEVVRQILSDYRHGEDPK